MKFRKCIPVFLGFLFFCACQSNVRETLHSMQSKAHHIVGPEAYLDAPYITPGNRVYAIGHQNGQFPDIGWHVKGEMGGIWDHPIKLMDGFQESLGKEGQTEPFPKADSYKQFPFSGVFNFMLPAAKLSVKRTQFSPDNTEGLVVEYVFENTTDREINTTFSWRGTSDLRPTWLGERTQMVDGKDQAIFLEDTKSWLVKDQNNPWYLALSADSPVIGFKEISNKENNTTQLEMHFSLSLKKGTSQIIKIFIAGSYTGEEEVLHTLDVLEAQHHFLFKEKEKRYEELAAQAALETPNKALNEAFLWLKFNADWFVRTVPEFGSGIAAGYPDYPWWFGCDSEYTLPSYMAIGQTETALNTLQLLTDFSDKTNGNGRIVHEVSTNGSVFNAGNVNETPQYVSLVWSMFQWQGEIAFLKDHFPRIQQSLEWILTKDTDGNGLPEGAGMMEVRGLESEMIDVAVYTQKAFSDAAKIASLLGEHLLAEGYKEKASALAKKINTDFWSEDFNAYADFIATDQETLHLINDAIIRADTLGKPWAVAELNETAAYIKAHPSLEPRPFVVHHNWVVNTPLETGIAPKEKAIKALETAEKYTNPFGVFVTGIDRDASAGKEFGSFKGAKQFSYTGAVMTLPTGVQAIAENNYGRPDKALDYLERILRTFSFAAPGSMYEVSPDYGMFVQAWNLYSFTKPIVEQFFGIQPNAYLKEVTIGVQMPVDWQQASLKEVIVGDNNISVNFNRIGDTQKVTVVSSKADWQINFSSIEGHLLSWSREESTDKKVKFTAIYTKKLPL